MISILGRDGNPILGRGYYKAPGVDLINFETGEGNPTPAYSFGTQIAEVKVDRETGKVKLLKMTAAHDCGTAINPMCVEGQLEGSISMGQGQGLFEELIWDKGQALNPSFLHYTLSTAMDMPEIEPILVDSTKDKESFEPKEAGEGTQVTSPVAIANAIYDAIGVRIKELPITPEKIIKALEKKKGV